MFVLGHLVSLHESRAFPEVDLLGGERAMTVMLPDLLSCHDWGYSHAWGLAGAGLQAELVVAHMLGDAVVHYGTRWRGHERKSGWAYCRMGLVTRRYDEFHEYAERCGWRASGLARDSRRGWAHTLVEYAIDQWLADRRDLFALHREVGAAAAATAADLSWVAALVDEHVIALGKPFETQPHRYCGALTRSRQPDEMHLRGLALKFGLCEQAEALDWLRGWLREIWQAVGDEEMADVLTSLAHTSADPLGFGYPLDLSAFAGGSAEEVRRWRTDQLGHSLSHPAGASAVAPASAVSPVKQPHVTRRSS